MLLSHAQGKGEMPPADKSWEDSYPDATLKLTFKNVFPPVGILLPTFENFEQGQRMQAG